MGNAKKLCERFGLSGEMFVRLLDEAWFNVLIADGAGRILYLNEPAARGFAMPRDEVVGMTLHDLVERGVISRSTSLEAIEKGDMVIGNLTTRTGEHLLAVSKAVRDEDGAVEYIMTNTQEEGRMNAFSDAIDSERKQAETYKNLLDYYHDREQKRTIVVQSPRMVKLFHRLASIAGTDSTVMLHGESGVGKDVVANHIHARSKRAEGPFIAVNCAAIPENLMESEFFGYVKGAFTGASAEGKPGYFEIADRGTLFLDEVGELSPGVQSKFLRVLETGEVFRVGATASVHTNVRIVAATNKDIAAMVRAQRFREDLYYRLSVIPITIPPLRERKEDIVALTKFFLAEYNKKYTLRRRLSEEILNAFLDYSWPGNIRELRNVVERMVITSDSNLLTVENSINVPIMTAPENPLARESSSMWTEHAESGTTGEPARAGAAPIGDIYMKEERVNVLAAMKKARGNKTKAAKILGVSKTKLYRLLKMTLPL